MINKVVNMNRWMLCFIFVLVVIRQGLSDQCTTPNGESAECVSLYDCSVLLQALSSNKESVKKFVRNSTCGGDAINPMVCCGTKSDYHKDNVKRTGGNRLIPDRRYCGRQHSDDYFHTVNDTVLSEFPWLVQIKVQRSKYWEDYECTGSLVNERYVLTSAWCLNNSQFSAVGVRLGEFHIWNKTDCLFDSQLNECSEDVQDLAIEEIIPHPDYDEASGDNDIGLIRMNKKTHYSDYIRPVCLPYPKLKLKVGDTLTTSGWGQVTFRRESVQKARLESTVITPERCNRLLSIANISVEYSKRSHFCVEPKVQHICTEENYGSPVMSSHRYQWTQEAVVTGKSYKTLCAHPSHVVFTNVTYYFDWIKTNLRP